MILFTRARSGEAGVIGALEKTGENWTKASKKIRIVEAANKEGLEKIEENQLDLYDLIQYVEIRD